MAVIDEVFTAVGEAEVVDALVADDIFKYVGWGTGSGTVDKADTDLWTAAAEARATGTLTEPAADTLQCVATIVATGTRTITEFGLFDGAGSGSPPSGANLIAHFEMDGQAVESSDEIEFTITLQFA